MNRCALVVGADCNSKILDWSDRSTCVLFGDGAGAVVLGSSDQPGIYRSVLHANGNYADKLKVCAGVSRKSGEPYIHMQGSDVFKFAVNIMEEVVEEVLTATEMNMDDIDWIVPHQANLRIITATARKLGMTMDRMIVTLQDQGNTSAASIPLALNIAVRDGRIKPGDRLLLEAVGGGFTWGATLLRY